MYFDSTPKKPKREKYYYCHAKLKDIQVGDYVFFGSYEQDNDLTNGKEDLEWLILDIKDNKALLITKYGIDCQPYHDKVEDVTWKKCTLRKWLNHDFIQEAFSEEEQKRIQTVTVPGFFYHWVEGPIFDLVSNRLVYETLKPLAKDTEDKVFLLSMDEANDYFESEIDRICIQTEYAHEKYLLIGSYDSPDDEPEWFLRLSCFLDDGHSTPTVDEYGSIWCCTYQVNEASIIRPALWLSLPEE